MATKKQKKAQKRTVNAPHSQTTHKDSKRESVSGRFISQTTGAKKGAARKAKEHTDSTGPMHNGTGSMARLGSKRTTRPTAKKK